MKFVLLWQVRGALTANRDTSYADKMHVTRGRGNECNFFNCDGGDYVFHDEQGSGFESYFLQILPATDGSDHQSAGDLDSGGTDRRDGSGGTERDSRTTDRDSGSTDRDSGSTDRDSGSTDRDPRSTDRDSRSTDRDSESADRDSRSTDRDSGSTDRDSRLTDRDSGSTDRDSRPSGHGRYSGRGDSRTLEGASRVPATTVANSDRASHGDHSDRSPEPTPVTTATGSCEASKSNLSLIMNCQLRVAIRHSGLSRKMLTYMVKAELRVR